MANQEQLAILKQGVEVWNQWRQEYDSILPDLIGIDFTEADLNNINLKEANLYQANFSKANLVRANLHEVSFYKTNLHEANLSEASLGYAHLTYATFTYANLSRADLRRSSFIDTNLSHANLTNCSVYGISVWNVQTEGAIQDDLVITPRDEPSITVDDLEIAQFIYLLLNNQKIRQVINTVTSKAVLILGRFTPERKAVLDALRDTLRTLGYLPILFDFDKPASRDITETVSTLAHLSRFVIADITVAKSIPQELMLITPNLPSVPVQPLILTSQQEYGMFEHFTRYPWVLPVYSYTDEASLLQSLQEKVITPAEQKAKELHQS
jgi:hypothetical protein